MSVGFNWQTESACQTKICQLDVTVLVNQQILWLQVSVHYSVSVAVGSRLEDLVSETLDLLGWERTTDLSHVLL